MMAKECGVSLGSGENILILIVMRVEYTKEH